VLPSLLLLLEVLLLLLGVGVTCVNEETKEGRTWTKQWSSCRIRC
jgi:hypothetical protein